METSDNNKQYPTFNLGLTMAGAVSAGCYTAGAMDYLFEMLDLWERAKDGTLEGVKREDVPRHKVVIEAMGGASAGGMVTVMSAIYALEGKVTPVTEVPENDSERFNILYDSWVHLDDEKGQTFEQLWDTDDLEKEGKLTSLFNSKVIDSIADRAFVFKGKRNFVDQLYNMAPYVSKSMELLLSHSMLRGIPLEVDFTSDIDPSRASKHATYEHFMISHFKCSVQEKDFQEGYMQLNPYDEDPAKWMKASTISTGAFPLGLKYRSLDYLDKTYFENVVKRIIYADFGHANPDIQNLINLESLPADFKTMVVDGGAINNEPYSEVMSILQFRNVPKVNACEVAAEPKLPEFKNYGLVMIDPFPDRIEDDMKYTEPTDLFAVMGNILSMLRNQSKVKRSEMTAGYEGEIRGEIYPSRKLEDDTPDPYPIACGSFLAFGGFLDIQFRKYDFFLGRDNARNFYRYFFSLPYYEGQPEKNHPIHRDWPEAAIKRFRIPVPPGKTGTDCNNMSDKEQELEHEKISFFLPIVPDMNMILRNEDYAASKKAYTLKERPEYNPEVLLELNSRMVARLKKILEMIKNKLMNGSGETERTPEEQTAHEQAEMITEAWMKKYYRRNFFAKLRPWIGSIVFWLSKRELAKTGSKALIRLILFDLAKRGLIRQPKNKLL